MTPFSVASVERSAVRCKCTCGRRCTRAAQAPTAARATAGLPAAPPPARSGARSQRRRACAEGVAHRVGSWLTCTAIVRVGCWRAGGCGALPRVSERAVGQAACPAVPGASSVCLRCAAAVERVFHWLALCRRGLQTANGIGRNRKAAAMWGVFWAASAVQWKPCLSSAGRSVVTGGKDVDVGGGGPHRAGGRPSVCTNSVGHAPATARHTNRTCSLTVLP
jgi:hypothetical protein